MPGSARRGAGAVRPHERRTKKLTVAFHFQFSDQAAWKCDTCRKSGLERKRRCGWLAAEYTESGAPVWTRRGISATSCPVSYITPASLAWIEAYHAHKLFGGREPQRMPARQVDAFCILESLIRAEGDDGE